MANFRIHKVVGALPSTLTPDTVYTVRVGEGFDLYISDATGSVAHRVNGLPADIATPVTDRLTSLVGTDDVIAFRGGNPSLASAAVVAAYVGASPGGESGPALGLWDWWYQGRIGSTNVAANDIFLGSAISSGTNTTAIPAGSLAGYNGYGVFLRSSTTANGGYRYTTSSLVSDYFGTISHKMRFQFLWRTAFTGRTVRGGYLDTNTSADATDGAYFEIDGDQCSAKTANNGTRTASASPITLALDTPYTFDIEVNAAGTEARFRVYEGLNYDDPVMDETITTNIPTTSARAFGAGVVATESSTTASDIGILYGMGIGTVAGFARAHGIYSPTPAATAPAAMTVGQWDAQPTATPGEMEIDITALPSDGGSAITALEYRVGAGAAIALSGTGTGLRVVTAGFSAGVAADIQVRAVNAVGGADWSDIKNRTPASAGGGGAAYLADTYTEAGSTSTTITRPAGAGAGHTLVALMFGPLPSIATQAAPTGWTAGEGVAAGSGEPTARIYTAPGDVAELTFTHASGAAQGIICFATTAPLRAGSDLEGYNFSNNPGGDAPSPSITATAGDLVVSVFVQADNGTGGARPGPIQSGYTQRLNVNVAETPPYLSVISAADAAAGATGAISHGGDGSFSTRFVWTGAFG